MSRALAFAKGDLNPHNFLYPTFYFYVLFAWVGLYLASCSLSAASSSLAALQQLFFLDPTRVFVAGRLLTALLRDTGVPASTGSARALFDVRVGLAAAAFLAVAPLHVRDSHYVKHDVPATLAVVLAYLAIVARLADCARRRKPERSDATSWPGCGLRRRVLDALLRDLPGDPAGVGGRAALARARRGAVVARHLVAAAWSARSCSSRCRRSSSSSPSRPGATSRPTARSSSIARSTAGGSRRRRAMPRCCGRDTAGQPVVALGGAGAGRMLVAAARAGAPSCCWRFPVAFLLFIASTVPASRYLIPLLPFVALLAAWALGDAVPTRCARRRAAFAVAGRRLSHRPLVESLRIGAFFRHDRHPHAGAEQFIERSDPAGVDDPDPAVFGAARHRRARPRRGR